MSDDQSTNEAPTSVQKLDHVDEIDQERVEKVALLSRLELTPEERVHFSKDLTSVIHHINKLMKLDLEDVPPTSHPIPVSNVVREDQNAPSLDNEAALSNAPEQEQACFKVPQII